MSRNLLSGFWRIRRVRGQSSEERVDNALQFLLEQGKIGGFRSSGKLDREGIDRLVSRGTKNYKLSVKSSEGGIGHEREDHPWRYRHDDIIFIVPGIEESRESVASRIFGMMENLEQKFRETD